MPTVGSGPLLRTPEVVDREPVSRPGFIGVVIALSRPSSEWGRSPRVTDGRILARMGSGSRSRRRCLRTRIPRAPMLWSALQAPQVWKKPTKIDIDRLTEAELI